MPREKECYRDNLTMLAEAFPAKKLIDCREFAIWAGIDRRTAKKRFFGEKKYMSIIEIASRIS